MTIKRKKKPKKKSLPSGASKPRDLFALYQAAVQDPHDQVANSSLIYADIFGRRATVLREDFCGTFLISVEWVRSDPLRKSICLDIDKTTLNYGRENNFPKLTAVERTRLEVMERNVVSVTTPKSDIILACNFSFFIFKYRATLIQYFLNLFQSLKKQGVVILELAGGPGFIQKAREQRTVDDPKTGKFVYIWDQKKFNPISQNGKYAIHFRFPDGSEMKDAFEYDWRIWNLPEIREAFSEAGFNRTFVYWEKEVRGKSTGQYVRMEEGANDYSWIAYVVGVKDGA